MSDFKAFADDKSSWTIPSSDGDEFTVENGKKKITASGTVIFTKDSAGAKTADELAAFFANIAATIRA